MNEDIFYVEFIGLPGAGKSSVDHIVKQILTAKGHSVYTREMLSEHRNRMRRSQRGISLILFIFKNFSLSLNLIFFGLRFKPINFFSIKYSYNCVRTIFKIQSAIKTAMRTRYDVVIFDQGILQDLWSIGVTGNPKDIDKFQEQLSKLLKRIGVTLNYSTVIFKVHIENAADRILTRGSSKYRFDNMDRMTILDILHKKSNYLQLIVDTTSLINQRKQLVIETNNTSIESSAQCVAAFISNEIFAVSSSLGK